MNLDNLNKWLSLGANLGVVAGIVFLALEIQQNSSEIQQSSSLARASAYQQLTQEISDVRSWIIADDELRKSFEIYQNDKSIELTDDEISKLGFILRAFFQTYESAYYFYTLGIINESEWQRFVSGLCTHRNRYLKDSRFGDFPNLATEGFLEFTNTACSS